VELIKEKGGRWSRKVEVEEKERWEVNEKER